MQTSSCYVHSLSGVAIYKIRKQILCNGAKWVELARGQVENLVNYENLCDKTGPLGTSTETTSIPSTRGHEPTTPPESQKGEQKTYLGLHRINSLFLFMLHIWGDSRIICQFSDSADMMLQKVGRAFSSEWCLELSRHPRLDSTRRLCGDCSGQDNCGEGPIGLLWQKSRFAHYTCLPSLETQLVAISMAPPTPRTPSRRAKTHFPVATRS